MLLTIASWNYSKVARLALSGILTVQAALITAALSEVALTTPGLNSTRSALAQTRSNSAHEADDAVVLIHTSHGTSNGQGSGVIIDSSGLIVTNAHVVEGAQTVTVWINGQALPAEVVAMGSSRCLDLALLKVSGQHNLPTLEFADADSIYKRQPMFAIGFPAAAPTQSPSVVQGIISNILPDVGWIMFDASINPGNSGGAIVDQNMRLLGIAMGSFAEQEGMKLAVSIDKVQAFVNAYQQGLSSTIGQFVIPASPSGHRSLMQPLSLDGEDIHGTLQPDGSRLCQDGSFANLYRFDAEAGQGIMLDMVSRDMESYLLLVDPNGYVLAQGGGDRHESALLIEKLPQTGTYTVITNTIKIDQTGHYRLRATTPLLVESSSLDRSAPPCFDNNARCRDFYFSGDANQTVTILMSSPNFDPYVMLMDSTGQVVAGGPTDRIDGINVDLPHDGWYTLVVSHVNPEEMGQFSIAVHDTDELFQISVLP